MWFLVAGVSTLLNTAHGWMKIFCARLVKRWRLLLEWPLKSGHSNVGWWLYHKAFCEAWNLNEVCWRAAYAQVRCGKKNNHWFGKIKHEKRAQPELDLNVCFLENNPHILDTLQIQTSNDMHEDNHSSLHIASIYIILFWLSSPLWVEGSGLRLRSAQVVRCFHTFLSI